MRKLLVLGVLVALLLVGDLAARSVAESAVESGVRSRVQGVGAVDAQIHSFPFTGRLVAQGKVSTLDLRLSEVTGHGIDVAWVRLEAKGLKLDRNVLLGSAHVRITGVDTVTVTANITEAEIRKATGADVRLLDGKAQVTAAGVTATADVTVSDGKIRLEVAGLPVLTVPVPDNALLPCPVQARVVAGAVLASCTAHQLPGIVVDAIGSVDLRNAG
ncbi:MAG: hypothetical protein JWN29_3447 [Acidimicrobiales bacterium]|nr:hypothetical protein [Acidimicrobiales bacterium]